MTIRRSAMIGWKGKSNNADPNHRQWNKMKMNTNTPPGFAAVSCPKCISTESARIITGRDRLHGIEGEFYVTKCLACGQWFQNPLPNAESFEKFYPTDYLPHTPESIQKSEFRIGSTKARYYRKNLNYLHLKSTTKENWRSNPIFDFWRKRNAVLELVPRFIPGGRLLEIGCASGGRLLELRNLGWENLYGVELSANATAIARANGFQVECAQIEVALSNFPAEFFDVIISSMVIEHLVNPYVTVDKLSEKLKPGGQFLFSTISRDGLDAKLYGTYWRNLELPRHMVWFTRKEINDMLIKRFDHVKMVFHAFPIDFTGSSVYRSREHRRWVDKVVVSLGDKFLKYPTLFLAALGKTSRVSVRCLRRII